MNSATRLELLSLVDGLCEGDLSDSQCARLEELVLADAAARRLYVRGIQLHGQLAWDAAGLGDREQLFELELQAASWGEPPNIGTFAAPLPSACRSTENTTNNGLSSATGRWRMLSGSIAALVLCALTIHWWPTASSGPLPGPQHVVVDQVPPEAPGEVVSPGIPSVRLPGERTHVDAAEPTDIGPIIDPPDVRIPQQSLVALIDREIQANWQANGITPAARAEDAEWLRRVHLDLAGRIPTIAEAERFLHSDSQDKRQQVLDRLLDGDEFPAYLSLVWSNLLVGRRPEVNVDALRGYLERQFAANRPWSEVVTHLVTATGDGDSNGAANFLLAHFNNEAVPATAFTARVLLGRQLHCSQCHQHPAIASWDQDEFWQFNACFQQTRIEEQLLVDQETGERRRVRSLVDEPGVAGSYYETLRGVMKVAYPGYRGEEIPLSPEVNRREQLAQLMLSGDENDVARAFVNRMWEHLLGHGFTLQVDDLGPHAPVSHPELFNELTRRFVASGYDVRELVTAICQSEAYQLSSQTESVPELDDPDRGTLPLFSRAYLKRLSPEQMFHSVLVASGARGLDLYHSRDLLDLRQSWIEQFFSTDETEENSELTTFDGSLPQALTLMNGELVRDVTDLDSAEFLGSVIRESDSDVEKIRRICLATLSRYPTTSELNSIRQLLRGYVRQRSERSVPPRIAAAEGLSDLYWAYLNSAEFSVNH